MTSQIFTKFKLKLLLKRVRMDCHCGNVCVLTSIVTGKINHRRRLDKRFLLANNI